MKIRVGILGAGRMGERHARAYQKIKDAEIVSFADVDQNRSKRLANVFKKTSYSIEDMLESEDIDAIDICTPNPQHAKNTLSALRAGKHVLVEKPMALTILDCNKMIKEAEKIGTNLMVGHTYRYYPSSLKAKKILDSGNIGQVKMVLGYGLDPGYISKNSKTPQWALFREKGGGVFIDAIHAIDLFRFWFKSEVSQVYVPLMDRIFESYSADQMGLATLVFENSIVGTIMPVSPSWGIRDTGMKIIGKKGALYVTYGIEVKVGKKKWKQYNFKYQNKTASSQHNLQGFVNEISEFISSIKQKRKPEISGEEGKKSLKVILAMYESFKKKKIVKIS